MPQISGLFAFIQQSIKDGTINNFPIGKKHKLKERTDSPSFYLLKNEATDNEPNPFSDYGFIAKDAGHIRIDSEYSDFYCHATESFIKDNQIITVRYYFDGWGRVIQNPSVNNELDLNGHRVIINSEQLELLSIRAAKYSDAITTLLIRRQEKILTLNAEIEGLGSKVLVAMQKNINDLSKIIELIQQRENLIEQKNVICDQKTLDSKDDSFTLLLQNLLQREHKNNITPIPQAIKQQGKNIPNSVDVKLQEAIGKLTRKSNAINDSSSPDVLAQYLENLTALRLEIFRSSIDFKLYKELDALKTEIKLYTAALEQGNLEKIKVLLPYCTNQINMNTYHEQLDKWFENAPKNNPIFDKKLKVFDYLHQNCDIFKAFIYIKSLLFIGHNGKFYSMLYMAFLTFKQTLFSALLRYGANPDIFWTNDENGNYLNAMSVLVKEGANTGFYVNELIRYGVKIKTPTTNKLINDYITLPAALQKIDNHTSSTPVDNINDLKLYITTDCAFLQFIYNTKNYNTAPIDLYTALVNNSSLESLLLALPYVTYKLDVKSLWLASSNVSGLHYVQGSIDNLIRNKREDDNCLSWSYIISGDKDIEFRLVGQLVAAINSKLANISNEELNILEKKILKSIDDMNIKNHDPFLIYSYISLNIIATFRSNLNEEQKVKLIKNFVQAGRAAVTSLNMITRGAECMIRAENAKYNRFNPVVLKYLQQERQEQNYMIVDNFLNAINVAYNYPNLKDTPELIEYFDKAKAILQDPHGLSLRRMAQVVLEINTDELMIKDSVSRQKLHF